MAKAEFDWVKARSECSPEMIFQKLKLSIKEDTHARMQALLQAHANHGLAATSQGKAISVFLQGEGPQRSVIFEQTPYGITVHDGDDKLMIEATLTLNDDGECRLKVGDKELELWQFRKLALEDLFFGNPSA